MTPRDELLAKMEQAVFEYVNAQTKPHGVRVPSASPLLLSDVMLGVALDVVLASGERRWYCDDHETIKPTAGTFTEDDSGPCCTECALPTHLVKCGWVVVLPVSLREGEPSDD